MPHKFFDTSDPDGFPIELDKFLKFQQEAYGQSIDVLVASFGNNIILTGCEETGTGTINVSDGYIICNNQLVRFIGGVKSPTFYLQKVDTTLIFQGGTSKPVLHEWTGQFGSSALLQYNWSDLRRINKVVDMWVKGDIKMVNCDNAYLAANFVAGIGTNERIGWAVCDGEDGRADMRGRVAIGFDDRTVDPANDIWDVLYNTLGTPLGERLHTLTIAEMPAHDHDVPQGDSYTGSGGSGRTGRGNNAPNNMQTGSRGGGQGHNNIQPCRVVLFIEKL